MSVQALTRLHPPAGSGEGPARAGAPSAPAIVIGAGAAGLGVALELKRRGVSATVLDRERVTASSWRRRYDGLRLNTVRGMSGAPGHPMPRGAGRWPAREDFVAYLDRLVATPGLDVRFGVEATRVDRQETGWLVSTTEGPVPASAVIVATGYDRIPHLPDWAGLQEFGGELIHSSDYRSPARFRSAHVLVVGPGNSGTEIATQLARAGIRVRLSVRTPVNLVAAEMGGLPATYMARLSESAPVALVDLIGRLSQRISYGDLRPYGMGRAPRGIGSELRLRGLGPVMERGFVAELKAGRIELVAALERLEPERVVLADGSSLQPDVVIAATGFRHGLEPLVGHLGVLAANGRPLVIDGRADPRAPGLHFHGFWLPMSGQLPAMRRSARRIARSVATRALAGG
ncbi:MAG TPA: NAD(P)/FAD-dependent oxidoreductase [Thermoleophilaceae bacterium]|nr:NAD(P)/FAD-dependent oxidoreductase [Thermoleophilaceae bacterium]